MPKVEDGTTRGHRKRARTRALLVEAGLLVLATRGDTMTVTDVVTEAGVSNGTFYNYFDDIDDLILVLAEHVGVSIAEAAAAEPIEDPAERFADATARLLVMAEVDPTWGRAFLQVAARPGSAQDMLRHARADLERGHRERRFTIGPEPAALDQLSGLVVMTIRRMVEGRSDRGTIAAAVSRGLESLGRGRDEANALADTATERARARATCSD
ncbi:MAG: TetR/AcrR family transcriptional regulator [Actinomycetota bacterium]